MKIKKKIYKVKWLPGTYNIIWDAQSEKEMPSKFYMYETLSSYINIKYWCQSYSSLYTKWLNEDDGTVYDIRSQINQDMIEAVKQTNHKVDENHILYFWFDIDRDLHPIHQWKLSPLSNSQLIELDTSYPSNNRFLSVKDFLIFPDVRDV